MNSEHKDSMIAHRMRQAFDTLSDARFLLDNNRSSWSIINRSYYGMFYTALALLQTIGEITSKHSGVISLFDLHFYKKGFFTKEHSRDFHDIFILRQENDYRVITSVSPEQAKMAISRAEGFVAAVEQYLRTNGLLHL
jgi:uncharacterized protein